MRHFALLSVLALALSPAVAVCDEHVGIGPLQTIPVTRVSSVLPGDTHILIDREAIESFLAALEGTAPNWAKVYGHGHHDPGHDERLFNLNRERDAKREGKQALNWLVTFVWPGELSGYDGETGGFRVAIGPKFNPTSWGVVRFKHEDLPSNLLAVPWPNLRESFKQKLKRGERIELIVAMTGRLIPEESIVYDFSHDQEGLGLIMPVVRVERVDYFLH